MKRILITLILAALVSPLFAGGQGDESDKHGHDEGLQLIATTSIIHDVVSRIAGDKADVEVLMDYGESPHAFEPAPRDMVRIEKADIVFVNGFDLEENLMRSINTLDTHRIVEVSGPAEGHEGEHHEGEHHDADEHEGDHHDAENHKAEEHEAEHQEDEHNHDHGGADPHTWMSPLNVMHWAERIAHALGEEDPENAMYYEQRASEYKDELKKLDHKIRESLESIPEEDRVIVTGHNAFGYFARDYHVTVVGTILPGFSTNSEPSAREMAELLHKLEDQNVKALFVGASSGDAVRNLALSLEKESDGEAKVVEFLTGSLRKKGEEGDSYISFMEYNLKQILYGLEL